MLQSHSFWMKRGHLDSHYGWPCQGTGLMATGSVVCKVMLFIYSTFWSCELWKHLNHFSGVLSEVCKKGKQSVRAIWAMQVRQGLGEPILNEQRKREMCCVWGGQWHIIGIRLWSGQWKQCEINVFRNVLCCLPKITMRSVGLVWNELELPLYIL